MRKALRLRIFTVSRDIKLNAATVKNWQLVRAYPVSNIADADIVLSFSIEVENNAQSPGQNYEYSIPFKEAGNKERAFITREHPFACARHNSTLTF
jgi:hypothetical protein